MNTPLFTERIAKTRNCSPELVCAIVTDCLDALHESTVKNGIGSALVGVYFELGALAAWHLGGILATAAENEPGELIEHYGRLDRTVERFRTILERWEYEMSQSSSEGD